MSDNEDVPVGDESSSSVDLLSSANAVSDAPPLEKQQPGSRKKKPPEPGLVYISYIPPKMTPLHIRQVFEKYGEVGRIFLQPDNKPSSKKKPKPKYNKGSFSEGWIELGDKRIAKRLALTLNNTLMEDGKKSKFADHMWNLKYLHRFRWRHLTERLTHEREVRKQKIRMERDQARKETAAFVANVEASKRLASIKERRLKKGEEWKDKRPPQQHKQRKTVEEMRALKASKSSKVPTKNSSSYRLLPGARQSEKLGERQQRSNVLSQIFGS